MPSETITPHCGYYGKVPTRGDFIKHNLPRSFIEPWDDWLQSAIDCGHKQLAEKSWLDAYLTSPIYRFVLTPGICGETSWIGILMPSVDRVGRYFPLTLGAPVSPQTNPLQALTLYEQWFTDAENVALSALEDDFELLQFDKALRHLDHFLAVKESHQEAHADNIHGVAEKLAIREAMDAPTSLPGHSSSLLDTLLRETCFAYSLWWTEGSEAVDSSLLITQGLPPVESTVALYDGNWKRWGWLDRQSEQIVIPPPPEESTEPWDR